MDGRKDALTDAALEREIESALDIEPSPEYLARIRARVAAEPRPGTRWFSWRFATSRIVLVFEALAVVFILVTIVGRSWWSVSTQPPASSTPAPSVAIAGAGTATTTEPGPSVAEPPVVEPPVPAQREQVITPVDFARAPRRVIDLPDVVIATNEVEAFQSLLANISRRDVELPLVAASDPAAPIEPQSIAEPPPVIVNRVEIAPVAALATISEEGERH